jgi:hypothetical protein
MGFGRGNLALRQDLQSMSARLFGPFATVQVGVRGLHTPNTSNVSFWIGPEVAKGTPSAGRRRQISRVRKYLPGVTVNADDG